MNYPRIHLKIWDKKGKEVVNTYSKYKRRIFYRLNRGFQRGFSCWIKVVYAKGLENKGKYFTKKDAIHAYKCFTEKNLIKDFKE